MDGRIKPYSRRMVNVIINRLRSARQKDYVYQTLPESQNVRPNSWKNEFL